MSHSSSGRYAQPYGNITVNGQRVGLPPANQFLRRNNFGDISIAPNGRVEVGGPGGIRVEPSGHIYFNGILTVVPYPPYVIHQGPPPVAPHPMGPKTTVVPKRRSVRLSRQSLIGTSNMYKLVRSSEMQRTKQMYKLRRASPMRKTTIPIWVARRRLPMIPSVPIA